MLKEVRYGHDKEEVRLAEEATRTPRTMGQRGSSHDSGEGRRTDRRIDSLMAVVGDGRAQTARRCGRTHRLAPRQSRGESAEYEIIAYPDLNHTQPLLIL